MLRAWGLGDWFRFGLQGGGVYLGLVGPGLRG